MENDGVVLYMYDRLEGFAKRKVAVVVVRLSAVVNFRPQTSTFT